MISTIFSAPRRVRRRIQSAVAALLSAAVVACGGADSSTGPSNADPTGLYSLRAVGKDAIPAQIFRGQMQGVPVTMIIGITGGELVLQEYQTLSMALDLTLSSPGQQVLPRPVNVWGEYEIDGGRMTLTDAGGNEAEATLRNGVVTVGLDLVGNGTIKQYTFRFVPQRDALRRRRPTRVEAGTVSQRTTPPNI